ncbi:hypothetical protein [Comamonas kerstersii]|uniref:hypothetical protein n=1 Tax=Comamonas kerstersii TaxID=225992 RepID=UPI001B343508|nr:hypothetical protein [Comamonas kerstersii]QTW18684.1 hypothetical protein H8N02_16270 [Comamonas kerstersii]
MKPVDSYLVLRVSWLREHDQVIGELVDLWLDRQAKQQPKPVPLRRRALRNTLIRIRSHVHAQ